MTMYNSLKEAQEAAALESKRLLETGDAIDFDGSTCEDMELVCAGWNGNDRRCDCGNNRVSWEFAAISPTEWFYYAERN